MMIIFKLSWVVSSVILFTLFEYSSASLSEKIYAVADITWSGSLDQNQKGTYNHLRTKVECGGQCMLVSGCSAFRFTDDDSCQLFEANYLYKDKTDTSPISVYIQDNLWNQRVHTTWTQWDNWSSCDQICDTGSQFRNRQCAGSNPRGQINRPPKTAQYGGERDCSGSARETRNCNTFSCNPVDVTKKRGSCSKVMHNSKTVEIRSPNYGVDGYGNNEFCEYEARIPTELNRYNRICFCMRWIETESCCDYVQILQSGVEKKKWAGNREDCYYASHGASPMSMRFRTDGSVTDDGFRLHIWPC